MNRVLRLSFSFLISMLLLFVANSALAEQAKTSGTISTRIVTRDKCAYRHYAVCVNNAYHRLRSHGDTKRYDNERQKCDSEIYQVIAVVRAWQKSCEGKRYALRCHHPPMDNAEKATKAEFLGCMNTVDQPHQERIARMDAQFQEQRRIAEAKRREKEKQTKLAEARQRIRDRVYRVRSVGPEDVKKPESVAKAEAAEEDDISSEEAVRQLSAEDANKPPAVAHDKPKRRTVANKPVTHRRSATAHVEPRRKPYVHGESDIDAERYRQWRLRYPNVANKSRNTPAYKSQGSTGHPDARINCVPEHVRIIKLHSNGDVELFIEKGADIYALQRCMPDHDWDAKRTISENIAAATIPYTLEFADKPMNRNKLRFNQDRWRIRRADWKKPGKQFFAAWLKKHEGKEIGFALQGGQRLKLLAKSGGESTDSVKTKPVEAVKHGKTGYYRPSDDRQDHLNEYAKASQGMFHNSIAQCASAYEPCGRQMRIENKFARALPSENEIQPTGKACGNSGTSTYRGCYEIKPVGRAYRAGVRSYKISHIQSDNVPRGLPQTNLWHRGRYGPYAFG